MRVSCMFPPKPSLWVARGLFIPSKVPCYRLARTVTFGYVCGFNFDIRYLCHAAVPSGPQRSPAITSVPSRPQPSPAIPSGPQRSS